MSIYATFLMQEKGNKREISVLVRLMDCLVWAKKCRSFTEEDTLIHDFCIQRLLPCHVLTELITRLGFVGC